MAVWGILGPRFFGWWCWAFRAFAAISAHSRIFPLESAGVGDVFLRGPSAGTPPYSAGGGDVLVTLSRKSFDSHTVDSCACYIQSQKVRGCASFSHLGQIPKYMHRNGLAPRLTSNLTKGQRNATLCLQLNSGKLKKGRTR